MQAKNKGQNLGQSEFPPRARRNRDAATAQQEHSPVIELGKPKLSWQRKNFTMLILMLSLHSIDGFTPTVSNRRILSKRTRTNSVDLSITSISSPMVRKLQLAATTKDDEGLVALTDTPTTTAENETLDDILRERRESSFIMEDDDQNNKKTSLRTAIDYIQSRPNLQLSKSNWKLLFDGIEYATASESEQIARATTSRAAPVAFPTLSPARSDMTDLYELLKSRGDLRIFGAARNRRFPAIGEAVVSPSLWQQATGLPLTALTPSSSSSRAVLLAGIVLASLESIVSITTGIPPNAMLLFTVVAVTIDRFVFNGGVLESLVQKISPSTVKTIVKHEAGHFLAAYILGCPVEGVVLSAWAALQDARFAKPTTAGTSFFDPELSQQLNAGSSNVKTITRSAIDRYSITVMAGIAAEANCDQQANGGAGDEQALIRFLSNIQGRWASLEAVQNQARWGALQAILLLRTYQKSYDALVDAMERGGSLAECIFAIEKAARENELPTMVEPTGFIVKSANTVQWKTPDEMKQLAAKEEESKKNEVVPVLSDDEMLRVLSERRRQVESQLRDIEDKLK